MKKEERSTFVANNFSIISVKWERSIIMPIIHIELLEGRTLEQKRNMVSKVTAAVVETAKCPAEAVRIIIKEMSPCDFSEGGILRSDRECKN